jgi:hypothetical protein
MQGETPIEAPFLVEHREPSVIRGIGHPGLDEAAEVRREEGWRGGIGCIGAGLPLARLRERVAQAWRDIVALSRSWVRGHCSGGGVYARLVRHLAS